MSQFDFPRINFFGKTNINVATCNNDDFKPAYTQNGSGLMLHDIVRAVAYTPPRVYVTAAVKAQIEKAHQQTPDKVPAYDFVEAGDSLGTEYYYVGIAAINTPEIFVDWAPIPLGQYPTDSLYHPLYELSELKGNQPGEWNFNGGMQNVIKDCSVVSVALRPTDNSGSNLYLAGAPGNCPEDLKAFLGGSFNAQNDGGANTAVVCDLNPSAAYSTQYFTDGYYLRNQNGQTTLMAGRPVKGVTRWINFGRVINIPGSPMVASGAVFQAIPAEAMTEWSALKAVFQQYGDPSRTLVGALVRYDLFEVYENRSPDYSELPEFGTNPAYMSVMGSITPWYEGEMSTASSGRLLNPTANTVTPSKVQLAPVTFKVDTTHNILSLDLCNTLPENRDPSDFQTYTNGNNPPAMSYTLAPLGQLDVKAGGSILASLTVDDSHFTRQDLIDNGGMFDWVMQAEVAPSVINGSDFSIWGKDSGGQYQALMQESRYVIQSDQSCAYANAGGADDSFLSQGTSPGPVVLRVMDRGVAVPQGSPVTVTRTGFGMDVVLNLLPIGTETIAVYDGMQVTMDASAANILLYVYTPPGGTAPTPANFSGATEFYLNLRVLPDQSADYAGYYLAPGQPGYKELNWDALFDEIFYTYFMLYPAMTQQLPLNDAASWSEPFTAGRLMQVIAQNMWDSPWYMPRSRDLSDAQRKLIDTWATNLINSQT